MPQDRVRHNPVHTNTHAHVLTCSLRVIIGTNENEGGEVNLIGVVQQTEVSVYGGHGSHDLKRKKKYKSELEPILNSIFANRICYMLYEFKQASESHLCFSSVKPGPLLTQRKEGRVRR